MKKIHKLTFYTFTCDACKNTLSVSEPFELHFCPFCGHCLSEPEEDDAAWATECADRGD